MFYFRDKFYLPFVDKEGRTYKYLQNNLETCPCMSNITKMQFMNFKVEMFARLGLHCFNSLKEMLELP